MKHNMYSVKKPLDKLRDQRETGRTMATELWSGRTTAKRANVIVFLTDQQRWDSTGVHHNPLGLTPNFDRVAASGTHFVQTFANQPVCGPSRACMQTGMYATSHGVYRNEIALPNDLPTLGGCFSEAGYDTAYIGKWHLGGVRLGHADWKQEPVPPERRGGYDYWLAADAVEFTSDAYHTVLFDNEGGEVRLPGYRVDAMTDAAIRYVSGRPDDAPFFLFLSFLEPHHQNHTDDYPAPPGYEEAYRERWTPPDLAALHGSAHQHLPGYWGMVRRLDEAFGRLIEALYSRGILDDTIVLFTSDHGNHFKTRNSEYKRSCHESSIRVPAAAIGPGFTGRGRVDGLFSLVDLAPTLLDAAGIAVPDTMEGRSAMPAVRDREKTLADEVYVQISESQVGRALRTRRWKYGVVAPDRDPYADSSSDHYTEAYLYDLQSDPYELTNLIHLDSHREVAARMKSRLLARMEAVEGFRASIPDAVVEGDSAQRLVFDADMPG